MGSFKHPRSPQHTLNAFLHKSWLEKFSFCPLLQSLLTFLYDVRLLRSSWTASQSPMQFKTFFSFRKPFILYVPNLQIHVAVILCKRTYIYDPFNGFYSSEHITKLDSDVRVLNEFIATPILMALTAMSIIKKSSEHTKKTVHHQQPSVSYQINNSK